MTSGSYSKTMQKSFEHNLSKFVRNLHLLSLFIQNVQKPKAHWNYPNIPLAFMLKFICLKSIMIEYSRVVMQVAIFEDKTVFYRKWNPCQQALVKTF